MCRCKLLLVWSLLQLNLHQRDSNLARMLFSSLYRSLFAMADRELTEQEAETTVKTVNDGLNAVLQSSTECCAPFIGSLLVSTSVQVIGENVLVLFWNFLYRMYVSMKSSLCYSLLLCPQLASFACSSLLVRY